MRPDTKASIKGRILGVFAALTSCTPHAISHLAHTHPTWSLLSSLLHAFPSSTTLAAMQQPSSAKRTRTQRDGGGGVGGLGVDWALVLGAMQALPAALGGVEEERVGREIIGGAGGMGGGGIRAQQQQHHVNVVVGNAYGLAVQVIAVHVAPLDSGGGRGGGSTGGGSTSGLKPRMDVVLEAIRMLRACASWYAGTSERDEGCVCVVGVLFGVCCGSIELCFWHCDAQHLSHINLTHPAHHSHTPTIPLSHPHNTTLTPPQHHSHIQPQYHSQPHSLPAHTAPHIPPPTTGL